MSGEIIAQAIKRRCYPVLIGDGEAASKFHVCALSIADRKRLDGIEGAIEKTFFALGRGLCKPDGSEGFPRVPGESDAEYAARISELLGEMPTDTFNELSAAINKVGIVPKSEVIAKN